MMGMTPQEIAALEAEDTGPMTMGLVITFTIFAFICVTLRLFGRIFLSRNAGWEDWFIVASLGCAIITSVFQIYQVFSGCGRHTMFLEYAQMSGNLKFLYFSIIFYCLSLTLTKMSILLQFVRLFPFREMRIPIYVLMVICVAYMFESVFGGIFQCQPVDAFWNLEKLAFAKCVDRKKLLYANAGINVTTDILIAILPIKFVWNLQVPRGQKAFLIFILSVGWIVCVVSLLRLQALIPMMENFQDISWYGAPAAYWSNIEMNLAIFCASAPALKPIVVRLIPRLSSGYVTEVGSESQGQTGTDTMVNSHGQSGIELKTNDSRATAKGDLERQTSAPRIPSLLLWDTDNSVLSPRDFASHDGDSISRESDDRSQEEQTLTHYTNPMYE
ncbi:hypothetical protein BS50DRAFT_635470 [Corynespora cassiicola Philippines]|uniref:Rhodopsin domain-containing protein n=1 Tax=Corynespora cassiicola Philippines TaxID=1448308 RepID=A0A2T2NLL1_CORCC|nr:hypothetical protein BS50DRAFT_635470 [Corynespora cassiicola Philippines]